MRSACFLVLLAATLAGCSDKPPQSGKSPERAQIQPENWFEDVTEELGVHFVHRAPTNFSMLNQIGSGVVMFDFDQDGRLDLYFVQNGGDSPARNTLFHQQSDGKFRDVSKGSGLDVAGLGMGAIAGDVNNDGSPDVIVTEYGATRLFRNLKNATFREVTQEAGIDNPRWAAPASFIDFDRDGWLDLVVGNYVDYDPTQICHDRQGRQEFCAPSGFAPTIIRLWRNVTAEKGGPPKFEDYTVRAGLVSVPGMALGLVCADLTGDRWPDIFCSDDGRPNRLFVNLQNGTFREEAAPRGLAHNAMGRTAANMGVAFADLNGDSRGDLFVTHLTEEFHSLYQQDATGLFTDIIAQAGFQEQGWRGTGFGTVAADFDRDGFVDIALVNGLVRRSGPGQTPVLAGVPKWWTSYAQRSQLFRSSNGRFNDVSEANPGFCAEAAVGRSLAVGDLDNDGAPDLVVGNAAGPARVFRNVSAKAGYWLKIRLTEPAIGGRDAIGAEVTVSTKDRRWWGNLQPATSYLSSNDPTLHFGLGEAASVQSLDVLWADGVAESFPGVPANQMVELQRGSGTTKE